MSESGRARTWVLIFLAFAGVGIGTLVGVGCGINANSCPFRAQPKQTSTDGATLFLANCAACHGPNAAGGRGPSLLSGDAAKLSEADLERWISHGKPLAGMPRFNTTLTKQQIAALVAYVYGLRANHSPAASPS